MPEDCTMHQQLEDDWTPSMHIVTRRHRGRTARGRRRYAAEAGHPEVDFEPVLQPCSQLFIEPSLDILLLYGYR